MWITFLTLRNLGTQGTQGTQDTLGTQGTQGTLGTYMYPHRDPTPRGDPREPLVDYGHHGLIF
jgi:hypothetical protein